MQGQLNLDRSGYIIADETTMANLPGVYAVGDVRTKPLRQVVTAVADGATAVHMAGNFWQEGNDLKEHMKKWMRPALFTIGGALAGFVYYALVGCATGTCAITSSPVRSMVYMSLIGWLLSNVFGSCSCGEKEKR